MSSVERKKKWDINGRLQDVETVMRWCTICATEVECENIPKIGFDRHLRTHKGYGLSGKEDAPDGSICNGWCEWLCCTCGASHLYRSRGRTHGGPSSRLIDRRFGLAYCREAKYPDHKRYLGTIDGKAGPVVFRHSGTPNPEQPVQDDPTLKEFLSEEVVRDNAKKQRGSRKLTVGVERKTRRRPAQG